MKFTKETAIIILAPICYLIGTIGVIRGDVVTSLLFYCAESVLLSILVYIYSSKLKSESEPDEISDELVLTLQQELTEEKQKVQVLEKEIEEKGVEILKSNVKVKDLEENIKSLEENIKSMEDTVEITDAFLPPVSPDEDDMDTIDIISIAKETAEELKSFAKEAGINVILSTQDESLLVRGNKSRMRIMFRNIIDNSVKYMNKKGNLIITISSIGDDIFIVLKDNGLGLSEDETKHIFELNYQGSNRISGNGLGLTQAKAIVDYYGGTIYAKSNKNMGMGIYIQLPTT